MHDSSYASWDGVAFLVVWFVLIQYQRIVGCGLLLLSVGCRCGCYKTQCSEIAMCRRLAIIVHLPKKAINWWLSKPVGLYEIGYPTEAEFCRQRKFGLWFEAHQLCILTYITCAVHERTLTDTNKKTRQLSYRKDDRAMCTIYGWPGKFRESWLAHGYFSRNL